jgi:hypothetical protein
MARGAAARFRQRRLVFRLPPLLQEVDHIVQRRRRLRIELACGASNKRAGLDARGRSQRCCCAKPKASDGVLSKALANRTGGSVGSLRHIRVALSPFQKFVEQLLFFPIE